MPILLGGCFTLSSREGSIIMIATLWTDYAKEAFVTLTWCQVWFSQYLPSEVERPTGLSKRTRQAALSFTEAFARATSFHWHYVPLFCIASWTWAVGSSRVAYDELTASWAEELKTARFIYKPYVQSWTCGLYSTYISTCGSRIHHHSHWCCRRQ